ncbi:MAG: RNA polymerase sigma factor [Ktedonobacteraceae bacterium]
MRQHFGVSPEDHDPDPEETLERYHPYIVALVRQGARCSSNFARPGQFDLEVDEMAQRVLIKFWQALAVKHIEHHKAYLRTIVCNEFNDLSRKRKQPLPLLTDDDGEWYSGDARELEGARTVDPADEFAESESLDELMDSTAVALAKLAPRQQRAMICELYEKIDSTLQFIQVLHEHRVEVKTVEWPEDEEDKRLLKASLSPARHKMAYSLGFDMDAHKKKA